MSAHRCIITVGLEIGASEFTTCSFAANSAGSQGGAVEVGGSASLGVYGGDFSQNLVSNQSHGAAINWWDGAWVAGREGGRGGVLLLAPPAGPLCAHARTTHARTQARCSTPATYS